METLRKRLDKVLEFICCTLLALMTILVTWQVVSRYVLKSKYGNGRISIIFFCMDGIIRWSIFIWKERTYGDDIFI